MTESKLTVLLIHRFFKPDSPPYAFILDDIRYLLGAKGAQVDVLSSQPSYKSVDKENSFPWKTVEDNGSTIFRLPVFQLKSAEVSKFLNFGWFPIVVFWFVLLRRKYDIVTVSTAPPVVLAFMIAFASKLRGFKLVYHCMDLHPEIGRLSGEFKNNALYKLFFWMEGFTCRTASKIIVLSTDMKASLMRRDIGLASKVEIINNYDLSFKETPARLAFYNIDRKKRVIFAGNIGRFQNLHSLVLALKNNPWLDNFELIFVGEGAALEAIKSLSAGLEDLIRFIPHQPAVVARQMISDVDMAVVSLQEDVIRYAFPSKTMTYLAVGTPILAMVESDSELATFISSNDLGQVIAPNDRKGIYDVFKALSEERLHFDRKHIIQTFEKSFSRVHFNQKFITLVDKL